MVCYVSRWISLVKFLWRLSKTVSLCRVHIWPMENTLVSLSPLNPALLHSVTRQAVLRASGRKFIFNISDTKPWVLQVPEKTSEALWVVFFSWLQRRGVLPSFSPGGRKGTYSTMTTLSKETLPPKRFCPWHEFFALPYKRWANAGRWNFMCLSMSYTR